MTLSWLFPWDDSALQPAFVFTRVRRQTVSTGMLFFSLLSVGLSPQRKHKLALGGLTEWHSHAKIAKPLPSVNATKRHCSAG